MADRLVRVRHKGVETNMSRSLAERSEGVEMLDEAVHNGDGTLRATTRKGGRRAKPKTTVAEKAAAKKAAAVAATDTAKEA